MNSRLDYQPLLGKWAGAPSPVEIEPSMNKRTLCEGDIFLMLCNLAYVKKWEPIDCTESFDWCYKSRKVQSPQSSSVIWGK